jgi:hypothetical protein
VRLLPLRLEQPYLFEVTVDGNRVDVHTFIPDNKGDTVESKVHVRPLNDKGHVLPHEGSEKLPALIPEEHQDEAQRIDGLAV